MALVHPDCAFPAPPVYHGDYVDAIDAIDADGTVPVLDGPGLGVSYDWDYIDEHRIGGRTYE